MSNCARCGKALPSFSVGELQDVCPDCQHQAAAEAQLHPPSALQKRRIPRPKVTIAIIAINVAVFIAMVASGVSPVSPTSPDLIRWGADWGPASLSGQPWRMLTSNYVHIGILHILLNMWCLWNLGVLAELIFGRLTFLSVYTLTGIAGSVLSLAWNPNIVSAGASGAVFGIAGALISALYLGRLPYSRDALRPTLKSVVMFAVYNLFIGAASGFVNNAAHVGGLLMGLALGAVLGRVLMAESGRRQVAEVLLFLLAAAVLLFGTRGARKMHADVVTISTADRALQKHSPDEAIRLLEPLLKTHPHNLDARVMLGRAYLMKRDFSDAETELARVAAADPRNLNARYFLGETYLASKRWEQARDIFASLTRDAPKEDEPWVLLGNSLNGMGRQQEAIDAYRRAIVLNPRNSDAYRELGILQLRLKQNDAALQNLIKAAELDPNSERGQRGLSAAYFAAGKAKDAEEASHKADQIRNSRTSSDDGD